MSENKYPCAAETSERKGRGDMSNTKRYPTRMHEVLDIPESEVIYGFKDVEGNHWFDFFLQTDGLPYEDNLRILSTSKLTSLINHPERILRKPRLSEEQVRQLKALVTLGYYWLVVQGDGGYGYAYACEDEPAKDNGSWTWFGSCYRLRKGWKQGELYALVSWSDPVPLDIVATLRDAGVEVE